MPRGPHAEHVRLLMKVFRTGGTCFLDELARCDLDKQCYDNYVKCV